MLSNEIEGMLSDELEATCGEQSHHLDTKYAWNVNSSEDAWLVIKRIDQCGDGHSGFIINAWLHRDIHFGVESEEPAHEIQCRSRW
jgi:hypothetical protein